MKYKKNAFGCAALASTPTAPGDVGKKEKRKEKRNIWLGCTEQKRPISPAKETYISSKRDLYVQQKRPTNKKIRKKNSLNLV